ncbi:MAG: TonB-dependent receptor [Halothiobacillaceae bacterium]|nr:TonB-dependent receptor [Halothiobacillaceae bacterium]
MKKFALSAAILAASTPFALFAADALDELVVTAARSPQNMNDTIVDTTLITRSDIERSQARDLQDLMQGLPGISFANNGGAGKSTSMFLRGTNADHVLVLVDGIRMGSATLGSFSWEQIPLAQIERIEVTRGPASSLYGSEAIGGVVQIFTRKGTRNGFAPRATLGGGSYGTFDTSAGFSGGNGQFWGSGELAYSTTDGFNAYQGSSAFQPFEGDNDGYRNTSGSLRAGAKLGEWGEAGVNWMRVDGKNDFDGSFVNQAETRQEVFGATLNATPMDNLSLLLNAGQSRDEADNFLNGAFQTRFNTQRDSYSAIASTEFAAGQTLNVGADYLNDRVDSTTAYKIDSRDNTGVFAEWLGRFGNFDTQASARHDDNQQFGGHDTWTAGAGYRFSPELRLSAIAGSAFKAPTFNQLYFPGFGNADLKPEESTSYEIGLDGTISGVRWESRLFQNEIDQLIVTARQPNGIYLPSNLNEARIRGLEASLSTRVDELDLAASYTYLDPEQIGGVNNGKLLPRRAQNVLRLDADQAFGAWRLGGTLNAVSGRYDDVANTLRMGGYTTVDLRGEYVINPEWRIQARIVNLFDKDYETAYLYNQTGRAGYITLRYGM